MNRDFRYDSEGEPNMRTPAEAGGLVERLRAVVEISEPLEAENCIEAWNWLVKQAHEAASTLASERAAHAETKRERDDLKDEWQAEFESRVDANTALRMTKARLAEALEALEPFAEIAGEPWADENGWTNAACQNDRICDWFGPSAFRAARRALGGKKDG